MFFCKGPFFKKASLSCLSVCQSICRNQSAKSGLASNGLSTRLAAIRLKLRTSMKSRFGEWGGEKRR